jgi:hypothetical protein
VSIKDIDAFCGFLDDVGANKGVMISHSGFTDGAKKRAAGAGIELRVLTFVEAEDFDWEEFARDSCQGFNDCYGSIDWVYTDGGSEVGFCNSCGLLHILCGECGSVNFYNQERVVKCDGCEMRWNLQTEKGDVCGIKELPPEKDSEEEEEPEGA